MASEDNKRHMPSSDMIGGRPWPGSDNLREITRRKKYIVWIARVKALIRSKRDICRTYNQIHRPGGTEGRITKRTLLFPFVVLNSVNSVKYAGPSLRRKIDQPLIFLRYEMIGLSSWSWPHLATDSGSDSCDMVDLTKWWTTRRVMAEALMAVWNCFGSLVADSY